MEEFQWPWAKNHFQMKNSPAHPLNGQRGQASEQAKNFSNVFKLSILPKFIATPGRPQIF